MLVALHTITACISVRVTCSGNVPSIEIDVCRFAGALLGSVDRSRYVTETKSSPQVVQHDVP